MDKGELGSQTIPLEDYYYREDDISVTEDGHAYIAGNYYKKEKPVDPVIVAYSAADKSYKVHRQEGDKLTYSTFTISILSDDTPLFGGIYNDKAKKEVGYRFYKIDPRSHVLTVFASAPFATEYAEVTKRGGHHPEYFTVFNVLQLPSGNIAFSIDAGRSRFMGYVPATNGPAAFVASLNATGAEQWHTIIQKEQIVLGWASRGHHLFNRGNKVYMIYNDSPDNFELDPTDRRRETMVKNKCYAAIAEIDETGKVRKVNLTGATKKEYSACDVDNAYSIDGKTMQFLFKTGESYKFATFSTLE